MVTLKTASSNSIKGDFRIKQLGWLIMVLFVSVSVMTLTGCSKPEEPAVLAPLEGEINDLATDFIAALVAEDFEAASGYFDAEMLKAIPTDKLEDLWEQLLSQVGPYQNEIGRKQETSEGYEVIIATVKFEKSPLNIRMVFNDDHRISGLFFQPAEEAAVETPAYEVPNYAAPERIEEREIVIGKGDWALPGTLTLPAGEQGSGQEWPLVVLVHGSGPNDRDETIGPNKPFKDLALGLASEGVAVLRYDKRTLVHGQKLMAEVPELTVQEETIEDALLAVDLAMAMPEVDASRVYVLGHSLGGMLAPRIGVQSNGLAGLIIMAGAARPLEELMLEQMTYLAGIDGDVTDYETANLKEVKEHVARIQDPKLDPKTPQSQLLGVPAAYWLDLQGYKPAEVAKTLDLKMLILQGERDYQVTMADFELWKTALSGRNGVMLETFPELNHLMMTGSGSSAVGTLSTPEEYNVAGHVSVEVIQAILEFVN